MPIKKDEESTQCLSSKVSAYCKIKKEKKNIYYNYWLITLQFTIRHFNIYKQQKGKENQKGNK